AEAPVVLEVPLVQRRVESAEHRSGIGVVGGGGSQGVADQGGEGGGVGAFAADIAEEQAPPVMTEGEQVVEVTAHLVRRCDVVVRGSVQAGDGGQGGRQQALLQ